MDVTVGVLSPGKVGKKIMALCRCKRRIWAGNNRSRDSHKRAKTVGLEDVGSVREVANQSDLIISLLPPAKAIRVAERVRNSGFEGVYVDLNTLSPESVREIEEIFEESKIELVDGAVLTGRHNRLEIFLSGSWKSIDLFKQMFVDAEQITVNEMKGKRVGQSSLLGKSYPDHYRNFKTSTVFPRNREMREIAQSFADEGMYDGFALSAAQFYSGLKENSGKSELTSEEVISEVLKEAISLSTNKVKVLDNFEKRNSFASIPDVNVKRDSFASISDNESCPSIPGDEFFVSLPDNEEKLEI